MEVQHEITIADAVGAKSHGTVSGDSRHWSEGGLSRRECSLLLLHGGVEFRGVGDDYFDAFCRIREQLAERRLIPICYGASRNVYPSGMCRDMGRGLSSLLKNPSNVFFAWLTPSNSFGKSQITVGTFSENRLFQQTVRASRLEIGRSARLEDLVGIFDTGPDVEPATVAEQKMFADAWFDQFSKTDT